MKHSFSITIIILAILIAAPSFAGSEDSIRTEVLNDITILGIRAEKNMPLTFQNIDKLEIGLRNLGQDMPYMLAAAPSLIYTSDAGTGIGYTGMRIRGSDGTRINVTINGVPYNDAESQGTFWVNLPDFSSSVNSIQIQRGVGTSTNGAGAFGATVNMQTDRVSSEPSAQINSSFGSFNTLKYNLLLNSGVIGNHWVFEGKLAKITSDGFVDRATADLGSYYLSGTYLGKNTVVKALVFGGKALTYQAWNGVEAGKMVTNRTFNSAGMFFDENGKQQFYDREVDNYRQDHLQLHLSQQVGANWMFNGAVHYTKGSGYFEQYKEDASLADYGLPDVVIGDSTISQTDLIRRRWLDNDFYGIVYSFQYDRQRLNFVFGGGYNDYIGDHFGEIIWAQYASTSQIRQRYYDNTGRKKDFNSYVKLNYDLSTGLNLFADVQVRSVDYRIIGIDNNRRPVETGDDYLFFNPKLGLHYNFSPTSSLYASYAIANREPVRDDFIDNSVTPKPETLGDLEVGFKHIGANANFTANIYHMTYRNQLVLTGAVNDVGGSIRTNVDHSHRTGIELTAGIKLLKNLNWTGNIAFSANKIDSFTEELNDYEQGGLVSNSYTDTDISYSPNMVGASQFTLTAAKGLDVTLFSKFVGRQFLDNTSNEARQLDPYFINDLILKYTFTTRFIKEIGLNLMVNNLLNTTYESNGYAFGYVYGQEYREVYYFPQAGINFLAGVTLRF